MSRRCARPGRVVTYPAGAFLARPGDPADRFIYVEDGEIEVVNPYTDERHLPSTLGPTQFMGEIAFLNGGAWSMPMRAVRDTRVIEVPREAMLTPDVADPRDVGHRHHGVRRAPPPPARRPRRHAAC